MSTTVQEGLFLSDLLGAHDLSDFVPEVVGVSAANGPLNRGDVVCMLADGIVLAGSAGSTPAEVYGIVLDYAVGAKRTVLCNTYWSTDRWGWAGVEEFPNIEAVQKYAATLHELNWSRYVEADSLLGTNLELSEV